MKQAIVAVEDKRFYEHNGVDLRGIVRALWQDIRSQSVVEGGSTITQQYVKNAYSRNDVTIGRKVREAALAWQLTQRWSKDRILTAYLNTVYFGNGAYGILQAARTYFRQERGRADAPGGGAARRDSPEPDALRPRAPPHGRTRPTHVRARPAVRAGADQPGGAPPRERAPLPKPEDVRLPGTRGPAPYFVNYVTDQLVAKYGAERVFGGGLEVTTTIDLELQDKRARGDPEGARRPGRPCGGARRDRPADRRRTRDVRRHELPRSQFNLATQAERQPGSSFKPIVLASAFRQGISPSTRLTSKPIEIDAGDRIWKVSNYEGSYLGRDRPRPRHGLVGQLGVRAAHEDRRPEGDRRDGAAARHPHRAARVLLDRARRRRRQPARHDPRLRDDRERRQARRRVDHGRRPARRAGGSVPQERQVPGERARREDRALAGRGGDADVDPQGRRRAGHRPAGAARRVARRPARPARPTTTATPGSSATRPSSPSRCGSATRTSSSRWRPSSTASPSRAGRCRRSSGRRS